MTSSDTNNVRPRGSWIRILLFAFVLLLLTAVPAQRGRLRRRSRRRDRWLCQPCSSLADPDRRQLHDPELSGIQPADHQHQLLRQRPPRAGWSSSTTSCTRATCRATAILGHKIWFTNGSSSTVQQNCLNLLIPVEKINKQNPAGQTTAAIGVPFTYKLTIPVLFDPATGTVINTSGSPNNLHGITVWDDLNATGASLSYVSHTAYWLDDGTPVPHTFSNVGGLLTFDNFPIVPAGRQFVIELTVVLNDTPANAPGTQFINTAKWDFGRLIDGVSMSPCRASGASRHR